MSSHSWNGILNETKQIGSPYDVARRRYLEELYKLTGRNVILYYSGWLQKPHLQREPAVSLGISDADKNGFMSVIHKLDRTKGLDLILHTPGGDMAATESLVEYLMAMFNKDVRAIVPQIAMSGGTIMALACREIVMGKQSSIGPIDPQFGAMAASGLLQEFERIRQEIKNDSSNALLWEPVLRAIRPGFITECELAIEWSQQMATRFLGSNMFFNTPKNKQIIKKIIQALTEKKNTKTHGRHIGYDEASKLFGTKLISLEGDQLLQDAVLTVHHACIVTLDATPAYKIIENHEGRAFVQQVKVVIT